MSCTAPTHADNLATSHNDLQEKSIALLKGRGIYDQLFPLPDALTPDYALKAEQLCGYRKGEAITVSGADVTLNPGNAAPDDQRIDCLIAAISLTAKTNIGFVGVED